MFISNSNCTIYRIYLKFCRLLLSLQLITVCNIQYIYYITGFLLASNGRIKTIELLYLVCLLSAWFHFLASVFCLHHPQFAHAFPMQLARALGMGVGSWQGQHALEYNGTIFCGSVFTRNKQQAHAAMHFQILRTTRTISGYLVRYLAPGNSCCRPTATTYEYVVWRTNSFYHSCRTLEFSCTTTQHYLLLL